ncbi:hypothetical protein GGF32_006213 [Allomyces javanicus]|nr:hypothetical protein GGF32_006213 [Allomyces javanicus]
MNISDKIPNVADIVVVGAGPVGLYLAAQLHEYAPKGTSIVIVDRSTGPSTLSKAIAVHARSLETLAFLGPQSTVAHDMIVSPVNGDKGVIFGGPMLGDAASGPIASIAFPPADTVQSPYPFALVRVQSHTERILITDLERRGVRIAWDTGVTDLHVDSGSDATHPVTATFNNQQTVKCKYLVACDGGKSTVRHLLNIAFPGHTRSDVFWMADVRIRTRDGRATTWGADPTSRVARPPTMSSAHGAILAFPLQTTATTDDAPLHRIVALGGDEQAAKWHDGTSGAAHDLVDRDTYIDKHTGTAAGVAPPTLAAVERLFNERVTFGQWATVLNADGTRDESNQSTNGTGYKLSDPQWLTRFTVNERVAAQYAAHDARVFLAGDAAHVHSPVGGQGMNMGLQDAHNLAWKLATALTHNVHPRALLASYESERQPVAQAIVKNTSRATDYAVRWPWLVRLVGSLIVRIAAWVPSLFRSDKLTPNVGLDLVLPRVPQAPEAVVQAGNFKLRYPAGHRAPTRGRLVGADGTVAAPLDLYVAAGLQHTVLVLSPHDLVGVTFPAFIEGARVHHIRLRSTDPATAPIKHDARPFLRKPTDALSISVKEVQELVDAVQLDRVAVPETANTWVDNDGAVAEFLFGVTHDVTFGIKDPSQAWIVVVRPDGYMMMAGLGLNVDRVHDYLAGYAVAV